MSKLCWEVRHSTVTVMQALAVESQIWNWVVEYTMKIRHTRYVFFLLFLFPLHFEVLVAILGVNVTLLFRPIARGCGNRCELTQWGPVQVQLKILIWL